jgi:hypothetical protein
MKMGRHWPTILAVSTSDPTADFVGKSISPAARAAGDTSLADGIPSCVWFLPRWHFKIASETARHSYKLVNDPIALIG